MSERQLCLFDEAGAANTDATIAAACDRAALLKIEQVVVATTSGQTAVKTKRALGPVKVVGVTLQAGTWAKYGAPDPEWLRQGRDAGVVFLTATHSLMGNVGSAIHAKFGGICPDELIAHVYYTFGQGMKVAVEVALMAADAGLLDMGQETIAIAGTGEGADTAIVLSPAYTVNFFDLRIREVIAMPRK